MIWGVTNESQIDFGGGHVGGGEIYEFSVAKLDARTHIPYGVVPGDWRARWAALLLRAREAERRGIWECARGSLGRFSDGGVLRRRHMDRRECAPSIAHPWAA